MTLNKHLDADTTIAFLNGNERVESKIAESFAHIAISSMVAAELLYGARNSSRPDENVKKLRSKVLSMIPVFEFDSDCAETYSIIRVALRKKARPMPAMDLLIAAVAVRHNAILVTHNTKHFKNVEGLQLEDWLA